MRHDRSVSRHLDDTYLVTKSNQASQLSPKLTSNRHRTNAVSDRSPAVEEEGGGGGTNHEYVVVPAIDCPVP